MFPDPIKEKDKQDITCMMKGMPPGIYMRTDNILHISSAINTPPTWSLPYDKWAFLVSVKCPSHHNCCLPSKARNKAVLLIFFFLPSCNPSGTTNIPNRKSALI